MNNPIDGKISEINEKEPIKRAELVLKALRLYAKEFLDLWPEFMNIKNKYPQDMRAVIGVLTCSR